MTKAFLIGLVVVICTAVLVVLTAYLVDPSILTTWSEARSPKPVFAKSEQEVASQIAADDCLSGTFQLVRASAKQRVTDCSKALQSHKLTESEIAVARINRGVARMEMGDQSMADVDYRDALKHYDSVIDSGAPDAMALYRRGVALDSLGYTDRALSDYNNAIRLKPDEPSAYFERGILLATRKRAYDRAIADFSRALELEPSNLDAMLFRGDAYGQMGDFGHALADLDRAVELAPTSARTYFFRGVAKSRKGENQLALADYNTSLKINPVYSNALINRAAVYAADGKEDLALRDLDDAISVQRNNPLAFYNRGFVNFAKGHYALAIDDYSIAIRLAPMMGPAYNNRCLTRGVSGRDLVAALDDCDIALKLMPTNAVVRETLGFVYLKLGDPAIAIVEYNAALEQDPNRALALYGRGMAQTKMGRQNEGDADIAAALALNPSVEREFSIYGLN